MTNVLRIALGSDHRGYRLRAALEKDLNREEFQSRYQLMVIGGEEEETIDYPQVAATVATMVRDHKADFGILICGTGIGMCVVANKYAGIRAAPCHNTVTAELSRRHNNANILCLSGSLLGEDTCIDMVHKWLTTDFEGGRHQKRLDKITQLENRLFTRKTEQTLDPASRETEAPLAH